MSYIEENIKSLDFECTASSSSSCSFELSSLGSDIRFGGTMRNTWSFSHVSTSFSCITTTLDQQSILTGWCFQCKLIKSENLSSSFQDSNTSTLRESKCTDGQLGYVKEPDVIGDSSNHDTDLITFRSFHSSSNSSQ